MWARVKRMTCLSLQLSAQIDQIQIALSVVPDMVAMKVMKSSSKEGKAIKKDINLARRTVAKYREELGIPPTNLRRRYE